VWIVAELGVNHDGDPQRARALIDAAAAAGADAVKLQYFRPDRLLSKEARLAAYQKGVAMDPYELLAARQLTWDAMRTLRGAARQAGLAFIVTPFSLEDVAEVAPLELDAVKIASPDAVNTLLLDAAVSLVAPMLISTGACTLDEVKPAATLLQRHVPGGALPQCVSSYPAPMDHAALGGIGALHAHFGLPVGYSDHTSSTETAGFAVAAGACVLEKHLTYDRGAPGPDHAASLDPSQFKQYAEQAREAAAILGPLHKAPLDIENEVARVSRQSVCAARNLAADHVIEASDLTLKRPGTGIPARALEDVISKTLTRSIEANTLMQWHDLS
jgi:N-acetylneuraminate synthase/N,N'-diacetyllegionaminate synthase